MDKIKNQNKKDKRDAFYFLDDENCQNPAANLTVPAANSSQVPFADTATMAGRRGGREQENYQRPVVASETGQLKGESTAATLHLSSLQLSSNTNNNSKVTGIMLKSGALSARQLDTSAKQHVYTERENKNKRSMHVDTTNSSHKKAMKDTFKICNLEKNVISKSIVQNSTSPFSKHSVKPTGKDQLQEIPTHPGAMAMFPEGHGRPVLPQPNSDITFMNQH
jgi:hypothetical protein